MNTKDNRQRTTDNGLQSTANSQHSTISTKEIDIILDWIIDHRKSSTTVVFLGMNERGQKIGFTLGRGGDVEELFYRMIKNNDDVCDLMLAAIERYHNEIMRQQTTDNRP